MTREEVLERVDRDGRASPRRFTSDVEFSAEDATRSDWDFLVAGLRRGDRRRGDDAQRPRHRRLHDAGRVRRADGAPAGERARHRERRSSRSTATTTSGMATANTLAAVRAGARQVEVTINGIGERAGNTALEEVVMALATRGDQFGGGVHPHPQGAAGADQPAGQRADRAAGAANKAIVGANAFAHEAGIHQDGMLKERTTYEIMNPTDVGWEGTRLVLGKHSGRAGFRNTLKELGSAWTTTSCNEAYQRFLELADRKKHVTAADLMALVSDQLEAAGRRLPPRPLERQHRHRRTGHGQRRRQPRRRRDRRRRRRATARSTRCSRRSTPRPGIACELEEYHVEAVTPGEDAQGQVQCASAPATRSTPGTGWPPTSSRRARGPTWRR